MCSITGIWRFRGEKIIPQEIQDFNNATSYRGPDGDGIFIDKEINLALGHRRLSILDLSEAGKQPMFSGNENLVITFNGEIYNYLELKSELIQKGHQFRSETDTEVILAAYEEWGEACQLKFNGMWALAIWDVKKKELFLSRDRFGVKPLYYIFVPEKLFAFASESIGFGLVKGYKKEFDDEHVDVAIRHPFQLENSGETIYKGIKKLLPGHSLRLKGANNAEFTKWWKIEEHLVSTPSSYAEQVEHFKYLLTDSCKLRLRSDVPVGTALSGGLDSSSIYSFIQQINKATPNITDDITRWKTAFIASFPGTTYDEKKYAEEIIRFNDGLPKYIYPHNERLSESIYKATKAEDFIYISPPVVHNIYKSMRANNFKVSLDGHGADEILFGYPTMISELIAREQNLTDRESLFQMWAEMSDTNTEEVKRYFTNKSVKQSQEVNNRRFTNYVPELVKKMYRRNAARRGKNHSWLLHNVKEMHSTAKNPFTEPASDIIYRELHLNLPTLLRNWDRASMRHGVEIRMPFLDWRLVSYIFSLPKLALVNDGFSKKILRDATVGIMPDSIRLRKNKIGINAPVKEWFNNEMSHLILDIISSSSFVKSNIWNGVYLRKFAEEKTRSKTWTHTDAMRFWPILNAWMLKN